jgi:hypothetical protein
VSHVVCYLTVLPCVTATSMICNNNFLRSAVIPHAVCLWHVLTTCDRTGLPVATSVWVRVGKSKARGWHCTKAIPYLTPLSLLPVSVSLSFHSQVMPSSSAELAAFATITRLLSCLVTESLVRAIFIPLQWSNCVGIGVVLKPYKSTAPYSQEDILSITLLRYVPILKPGSRDLPGYEVGLLDPRDMYPLLLVTSPDGDSGENEVWLMRF